MLPQRRRFVWPLALQAMRHANYRLFWGGAFIANIGAWVRTIALGWLVLELTGSPLLLGLVSFAQTVPVLLLSLPAGVLADRFDRRLVLLATQLTLLLLTLVLSLLVLWQRIDVPLLIGLSLLMGLAMAVNSPAWQVFITDLVGRDDLMNAIALNSAQFNLSRIIGPSLAGLLIAAIGLPLCFFINSASYLGVLAALLLIRLPGARPTSGRLALWQGIREGLVYLRDAPLLRGLMLLTAAMTIFGFPYAVLMPIVARDILGQAATGYGQLMAATGLGAFAGALGVAVIGRRLRRGRTLLLAELLFAVSLLLFALTRWYGLALLVLVLLGASMIVYMALANTVIQGSVPEALRGRVMSVWTLISFGLTPLGSLQAGALASLVDAPFALLVGAVSCGLAGLATLLLVPSLRRLA